jgi:hypothetical protein
MADTLRLYKSIATMDRKAPLPALRSVKPTWHKAAALAREWALDQLASRLDATTSLIEMWIDQAEWRVWFLFETSRRR